MATRQQPLSRVGLSLWLGGTVPAAAAVAAVSPAEAAALNVVVTGTFWLLVAPLALGLVRALAEAVSPCRVCR